MTGIVELNRVSLIVPASSPSTGFDRRSPAVKRISADRIIVLEDYALPALCIFSGFNSATSEWGGEQLQPPTLTGTSSREGD